RARRAHRLVGARGHELADVRLDVVAFAEVELAVDVAEGGEVEDDRPHLLFGDVRVGAEAQHQLITLFDFAPGVARTNGAITASNVEPSTRCIRYSPCMVPRGVSRTHPDVY